MMMKKKLRSKFQALRKQCHSSSFDFHVLLEYFSTLNIDRIFCYAGHDHEPDPLLAAWEHPIALPKVRGYGEMDFFSVFLNEKLNKDRFGIREPRGFDIVKPTAQSIILLPCVAVDARGTRLGMGGGYYDRYLQRHDGLKIGIVYPEQVSPIDLPREEHDVTLDSYYDGEHIVCVKQNEGV